MIARRQEIWDVCRTAARFCLLYDNDQRRSLLNQTNESSSMPNVFQRDLIRILAEIHFIAGEVEIENVRFFLISFCRLKSNLYENVELNYLIHLFDHQCQQYQLHNEYKRSRNRIMTGNIIGKV